MSLSKINPTKTKAWKALLKKKLELDGVKIIDLFDSTNDRLKKFSINFKFLSLSGGKEKVVGVIAKRARGEMARFLIDNQIESTDGINKFSCMGFKFKELNNNCFTFVSS